MRSSAFLFSLAAGLMSLSQLAVAQQTIFGRNLVVNGDAETGPASNGIVPVSSVPGWTRTGTPDVVAYGDGTGATFDINGIAPLDHKNQYFVGGPNNKVSSLSQDIDVTSGATVIDAGSVVFTASAYLGGFAADADDARVTLVFKSASGQALGQSVTLGPVNNSDPNFQLDGLILRRAIGLVPVSTRKMTVTILFTGDPTYNEGSADSISLVLNQTGSPQSVLGVNLIVNGDAESGPTVWDGDGEIANDIPGWPRTGQLDVDTWQSIMTPTSPGPASHGNNLFTGGPGTQLSTGYQDIDVSAAATQIDSGTVQYAASAWLGGLDAQDDNATVTIQFLDWSGKQFGSTVQLGSVMAADRKNQTGLLQKSQNGGVPVGTRQIHVVVTMVKAGGQNEGSYNNSFADNISLVLSVPSVVTPPAIKASSVVSASAFGGFSAIAPGSWVEIYGSNLSTTTRSWTGSDFIGSNAPTSLDGVTVTIGGQKAFIDYISPTQVNAQAPSNVGIGPMQLVVTNSNGSSAPYALTVSQTEAGLLAPSSFTVNGKQYVVAILSDGTYVLPTSAIAGVASRPARPGETITLYGIGFGGVNTGASAGTTVSQANTLSAPLQVLFGQAPATLLYDGLAPGLVGLYQFNAVVPNVADSDLVPLTFNLGGVAGTQTLYTAVHQ